MLVTEKCKSLVHRARTALFKVRGEWGLHPLNVKPPATDWGRVDKELQELAGRLPFNLTDFPVDAREYVSYKARFRPGALYAMGYQDKKIMEHFLSYKLLGLRAGDTYVDVASENSPFPALYRANMDMKVYSQDLTYKPGVHGDKIGSSADQMPVPAASVDKVSLHCAFEHFCGPVDTNFMRELKRVLRPGGRCVIVPLYMASTLLNVVDPVLDYGWITFDDTALVIGETNLGGLFERYYSPESLSRILLPDAGLCYELFRVGIPAAVWDAVPTPQAKEALQRVRYALRVTSV